MSHRYINGMTGEAMELSPITTAAADLLSSAAERAGGVYGCLEALSTDADNGGMARPGETLRMLAGELLLSLQAVVAVLRENGDGETLRGIESVSLGTTAELELRAGLDV